MNWIAQQQGFSFIILHTEQDQILDVTCPLMTKLGFL